MLLDLVSNLTTAPVTVSELLPWLPVIAGVSVAVVAGAFTLYTRIRGDRESRRIPMPPSWPEMYARMAGQDAKIAALGRLWTATVAQWPEGAEAPTFDEGDLAIVKDIAPLPARWRRPRRSVSVKTS